MHSGSFEMVRERLHGDEGGGWEHGYVGETFRLTCWG